MRIQRQMVKPSTTQVDKVDLHELKKLLSNIQAHRSQIIPLLQITQQLYGYIPAGAFDLIAETLQIPVSEIYGVATFYAQFRLKPVGRHVIKVCHGTACHVQNARGISEVLKETLGINQSETTTDGMFTLETVACLGCCSLAPVMMIDEQTFGKLTGKTALRILKELKNQTCQKENRQWKGKP